MSDKKQRPTPIDLSRHRKFASSAYIKQLMAEHHKQFVEPLAERVERLELALMETLQKMGERDAKLYEGLQGVVGPIEERVAKLERPLIHRLRDVR